MAFTTHQASPNKPVQPTQKEKLAPHVKMTLKGHKEWVNDVTFILGTRLLVTGSADKSLRVWDLDTEKQVGEPLLDHDAKVWRITASPDGRWIVSGGENGSILVWEVATNTKTELKRVPISFKDHRDCVMSLVFGTESETFASASLDETVCVWKRETGEIVLGPLKVGSGVYSVSYSLDGTKLAAGSQKHIIVWNTKTGKELLKVEQRAYRVAFTPDGLRLVSGNRKNIRISDIIAIAPNGTKFATTSFDRTARFFDLTTFEPLGKPLEHPDEVRGMAFSEDSQLIATACEDNLVRIWTVPLSESELQQSTEKILKKSIVGQQPCPRRAPTQTSRFFDDFDSYSPPGRNSRNATTSRHAEGSGIKNTMNRLFSRSSAPQDHSPRRRSIPPVDVFATRGKYRTANRHSGKRHKLMQQQRPPRQWQPHAGASTSSVPPAGTSNVIHGTAPAALQTGSTDAYATTTHPSSLDVEHVPDISCFAFLTRCFPCPSRTRPTSSAASRTS